MKILLKGAYPYKNDTIWGGVESVLYNLKKGFEDFFRHIDFEILSNTYKANDNFEKYGRITYIKNPKIKLGSIFLSSYPLKIKKILSKKNFDVLNTHSLDFAYYGTKYNGKLLFTLHGVTWEEEKYIPFPKRVGWSIFYSRRLKKVLNKIKYIVSINPYITKLVEEYTNAKIFEIPNPISEEYFDLKDNTKANRMLYMVVISRRKNLLGLVKALKLVKRENQNFELNVAGKIKDKNYYDTIREFVQNNNLDDNINFLGLISKEEKYKQIENMQFLVLPSKQETAPMVISEAFAAGKPVIASNVGGIPYMVGNNDRGLMFRPDNTQNIAKKISYLLENDYLIRKMGKKAEKYAKKTYSVRHVAEKYMRAYEYIINNL